MRNLFIHTKQNNLVKETYYANSMFGFVCPEEDNKELKDSFCNLKPKRRLRCF